MIQDQRLSTMAGATIKYLDVCMNMLGFKLNPWTVYILKIMFLIIKWKLTKFWKF